MDKSCGNCVNCEKYGDNNEIWACENYDRGVGMPFHVEPPNDKACSNWSDNPADRGKPEETMRLFIDHFWDEVDD